MPGQTEPVPPGPEAVPKWVFHAILMTTGFILVLAAGLLPVYGKLISGWYRLHIITAAAGSILVVAAVFIVFRVPYLSLPPSYFVVHVLLGLLLVFSLFAALLLALFRGRAGPHKAAMRSAHIWAGRAFIVLVVINILIGFVAVGAI